MEEQEELKQELDTLNVALIFLLLVIFAILLSLWATLLQRDQLRLILKGEDPSQIPPVNPIRLAVSAIIVGCSGYFLCLALKAELAAQAGNDPSARRSARVNMVASLLALLAALLRQLDLQTVERERQTLLLEETTLPD